MGIHHLHHDDSLIQFHYRGLPPIPVRSLLLAIFLLMFAGVVAALAIQGLAPKLSDDWYLRFDWWWRIILYMMIFVGPVALIVGLVFMSMTSSFGFLKMVSWDLRDELLSVTRSSLFGLKNSKLDIKLRDISEVRAFIGEERSGPIDIQFEVCSEHCSNVELDMKIHNVDQRNEALDVLFSIARLCGLTHYSIEKNGANLLMVSASQRPLDGAVPIPQAKQSPRYDLDRSSDEQRRALKPLAAAVGAECRFPWRWPRYEKAAVTRIVNSVSQAAILLGLIGVMGFFAWGVWMQGVYRAQWDAVAKSLEQSGASVTRAGISVGDIHIFGDGLMVEIKDREFTDSDLSEVLQKLEKIPLYALDLSNTAVTDEGIRQFIGRTALFLVSLRGTKISMDAVKTLAKTNLQSIDLRDTPIRLEHLKHFGDFNALSVLFLSDDEITESDLTNLDMIPYLDAVLVNDEHTTRQIMQKLNRKLPQSNDMTEVEKQRYSDAFSLKVAGEIRYVLD